MSVFTCQVKKVSFLPDQVEERGVINLDEAIETFRSFPFDAQLIEREKSEETSESPCVIFNDENGNSLTIWSSGPHGFSISYFNGTHVGEGFISNDYSKNPNVISVEGFIEYFFEGSIEQHVPLEPYFEEEIEEINLISKTDNQIFALKNGRLRFFFLSGCFLFFALILLRMQLVSGSQWSGILFMQAPFSFFWLPATILHITYWIEDQNKKLTIYKDIKAMDCIQNGSVFRVKQSEIKSCTVRECAFPRVLWNHYSYLIIEMKDGRRLKFTSLLISPEIVLDVLKVKHKTIKDIFPTL